MINSTKLKFILLSLLASSMFATMAPFTVATEQAGLIPAYAVLYRIIIITILAAPFVYIYARHLFIFTKQQFWLINAQALAGTFLNLAYLGALSFIPLSLAVIIFFTFPIITMLVTPFVFGGRLSPLKIIIFIIAFLGLTLIIGPKFDSLDPFGIFLAFVGAISAVVQLLLISKLTRELPTVAHIFSVHAISAIYTIIIVGGLFALSYLPAPPTITPEIALAFSGVVISYIMSYGLFVYVVRYLDPTTISLLSNIEPVVTIAIAIILFGETLLLNQQFGVAIVLAALLAGSLIKSSPKTKGKAL